jgi:RHS repeat-associated protein
MQRGPAASFYLYDGHLSTRQLTDAAQAVTDSYTFDAFGNLVGRTGSTPNDFLYTGEQFDATAGFYYLRARYYDPASGRFISRDTYDGNPFEPLTLHKYVYAHNNPMNLIDPSGHTSLAELNVTVTMGQMINQIMPTFVRAAAIIGGIKVLMEPGFEMRNWAYQMFQFCSSPGCFQAAAKTYEEAGKLISIASQTFAPTDQAIGIFFHARELGKGGFGFYDAMRSVRSDYRYYARVHEVTAKFEYLEVTARRVVHITSSVSVRNVLVVMKDWKDYSSLVGEAAELLTELTSIGLEIWTETRSN